MRYLDILVGVSGICHVDVDSAVHRSAYEQADEMSRVFAETDLGVLKHISSAIEAAEKYGDIVTFDLAVNGEYSVFARWPEGLTKEEAVTEAYRGCRNFGALRCAKASVKRVKEVTAG